MMKLIALMLFLQCFLYKRTDFGPVLELGLTITPDRVVFLIILAITIYKFSSGALQFPALGALGRYMLAFAFVCTASAFVMGPGSQVMYYLFDFTYNPFTMFVIGMSIPHGYRKLKTLSVAFLAIGAYLAVNGALEHFGFHALVWPQYILDPTVGTQFGRTRGSFASSEALGMALIVCFLFYALYTSRLRQNKPYWAYLIMVISTGVIYTTNQRTGWVTFGLCLGLLAIAKTQMRRLARVFIGLVLLGFSLDVGTHFSLWQERTLFSKRLETLNYRRANDLTTLAMGIANPIFGIGYGNFKTAWPQYFHPDDENDIRDLTDGNHNTFLGLFAEVGLVGLIPFLMVLSHMFRVGLRVYRKAHGLEREFVLVFLMVAISYVLGANVGDYRSGQFFNTTVFLLFGAVAGIDVRMKSMTSQRETTPLAPSFRGV